MIDELRRFSSCSGELNASAASSHVVLFASLALNSNPPSDSDSVSVDSSIANTSSIASSRVEIFYDNCYKVCPLSLVSETGESFTLHQLPLLILYVLAVHDT